MKSNFLTKTKSLLAFLAIGVAGSVFIGCSEDIDESNRYTFTGETITDYLKNRPEYSNFCYILGKAKIGKASSGSILETLATYGSYTCFAPINSAIEEYLLEQYELWESTKGTEDEEDTGIYSPYLEELSDSMATVIAKNHIIETAYFTTDIKSDGAFPSNNINNRITSISFDNDAEGNLVILINETSKVLIPDAEAENGIVHTVDKVVAPSNKMIGDHLSQYEEFSLHSDALKVTGLDETLRIYELDPDYDKYKTSDEPMSTAQDKSKKAPYPESFLQKYTLLAVSNSTYKELGINNLEDLETYAEKWYGDEAHGDYTNPKNAVYRLISYHILDRELIYDGNRTGGFIMNGYESLKNAFKSNENLPKEFDRYDYFETLHPYSIIKATRPKTGTPLADKVILNYAQEDGTRVKNPDMSKHINAVVLTESEAKEVQEGFTGNTLNGYIWIIDRLLIFDEDEMKGNILDERMRWDATSLFPELTNNGVRWKQRDVGAYEIYIPDGFCKRLRINNKSTFPFYLTPHETYTVGWSNYQGDELLIDGNYNFEYRLPYVPEGTYEIRFGFGFSNARGICQFYLDRVPQGIPVDMFLYSDGMTAVGNTAEFVDSKFNTDAEIEDFDKSLRNRGWMKGPASVILDAANNKSMRESPVAYRRIVTQAFLTGGEDHWLGFKDVTQGSTSYRQCSQDYLEIVPRGVITNLNKPEDKN